MVKYLLFKTLNCSRYQLNFQLINSLKINNSQGFCFNKTILYTATDYYPFGMNMPGRKYNNSSNTYRYGFNRKEKDNDMDGNCYDYGMRIYNPGLVRFLSVDPLTNTFPFYTPYQFAGNSPLKFVDLDGKEPQDYMENWQTREIGSDGKRVGDYTLVCDPKLGRIDAVLVYDKWTKTEWFVHQDDRGNWYYLKNNNGVSDVMSIGSKSGDLAGGHFQKFETQNAFQNKLTNKLMNGIGGAMYALVTAPFAYAGMVATGGGGLLAYSAPESVSVGAARVLAGAGSDILAQKTVDENASINWYSVVFNGAGSLVGANTWTTAAFASSGKFQDGKFSAVNAKEFTVNFLANGAAASVAADL